MRGSSSLGLLALVCAGAVGCNGKSIDLASAQAVLQDVGGSSRRGVAPIEGVYFGEIELFAFDYRPGLSADEQTGAGMSYLNAGASRVDTTVPGSPMQDPQLAEYDLDWSIWPVVVGGYDKTRDVYLEFGQQVDFGDLQEIFVDDQGNPVSAEIPPDATFTTEIGRFDADLFMLAWSNLGVVVDGVFYGSTVQNAAGWSAGVAANAQGQMTHPITGEVLPGVGQPPPAMPSYGSTAAAPMWPYFPTPGVGSEWETRTGEAMIFARADWFPEPVLVWLEDDYDGSIDIDNLPTPRVRWSSKPLDTFQEDLLLSFLQQGGSRARRYTYVVVPCDGFPAGPARIDLGSGVTSHATWDMTPGGTDLVTHLITIEFDLSQALDTSSYLPVNSTTSPVPLPSQLYPLPEVVYTGDTDGVPLGLRVAMVPRPDTCSNGTQDGGETDVDCGGPDCASCVVVPDTRDCAGNLPPQGHAVYELAASVFEVNGNADYAGANVYLGSYGTAWVSVDRAALTDSLPGSDNMNDSRGAYTSPTAATGMMVVRVGDLCVQAETLVIDVYDDNTPTCGCDALFVSGTNVTVNGISTGSGAVSLELALEGGSQFLPDDTLPSQLPDVVPWLAYAGAKRTISFADGTGGGLEITVPRGR